jgi:hypothetical protein
MRGNNRLRPQRLATPRRAEAAARTPEMGLKSGYKLGVEREKKRGNKQETLSREL